MKTVYLDNAATTCPDEISQEAVSEALRETWANPSSVYASGTEASRLLESSRKTVQKAFGMGSGEGRVIFTGCGTEANNLALFGTVYAKKREADKDGCRGKLLITDSEHPSVDNAAKRLSEDGFLVVRIPTRGGVLDLDAVSREADGKTVLASFMTANNETGAVYEIKKAAQIIREQSPKAIIHTDAVQAFMKTDISPRKTGVHLISVSAHKVYAPKGVGALWVNESLIKSKKLIPYLVGGGQEGTYRSGTENVPGIAGFAAALRSGMEQKDERHAKVALLCDMLEKEICEKIPEVKLNLPKNHLPYVLSITLPDIRSETMLNFLSQRGIYVSAGSACSAHSKKASTVLTAFGLTEREADTTLRVSLSHTNTEEDIGLFICSLKEGIDKLQRMR